MRALLPATVGVLLALALTPAAQAYVPHCGSHTFKTDVGVTGQAANLHSRNVSCHTALAVAREWVGACREGEPDCIDHQLRCHVHGRSHGNRFVECSHVVDHVPHEVTFLWKPEHHS